MNDPQALYQIYAKWTGQLHQWIGALGHHIDCEYFPNSYQFKLYSGSAGGSPIKFALKEDGLIPLSTVPNLSRPAGERSVSIQLPTPADDPSQEELDLAFRDLCLAAARVLEIDLGKTQLEGSPAPKKHAYLGPSARRRKRLN